MGLIELCERSLIPDWLTRFGMRRAINRRLQQETAGGEEAQKRRFETFVKDLKRSPIAFSVQEANSQHYELPVGIF